MAGLGRWPVSGEESPDPPEGNWETRTHQELRLEWVGARTPHPQGRCKARAPKRTPNDRSG